MKKIANITKLISNIIKYVPVILAVMKALELIQDELKNIDENATKS